MTKIWPGTPFQGTFVLSHYDSKKFSIIVSIIVAFLAVDVSLESATAEVTMASSLGIATFAAIVTAYGLSQFFILQFVKIKSKHLTIKSTYIRSLSTIVTMIWPIPYSKIIDF